MKIRPVGSELFHADRKKDTRRDRERDRDRQTDMTQLIVARHNFANSPKMEQLC